MKKYISLILSSLIMLTSFSLTSIVSADIDTDNVLTSDVSMDINGDNFFNCLDVLLMKNQMYGNGLILNHEALDVNNDGVFNIIDYIKAKEKLLTGTLENINYSNQLEKSLVCYETLKARSALETNISTNDKIYSKNDLLKYIDYYSTYNRATPLFELDKKFPIEKIFTPEDSMPYCVYSLDSDEKMYVFFQDKVESARLVTAVFIVKNQLDIEDFDSLETGMNLIDVEKIDAGTKYMDTIRNFPLYEKHTLHMVKNGFVKITYNVDETENTFERYQPVPNNPEEFIIEKIEFIPNGDIISLYFQEDYHDFRIRIIDDY